MGDQHHRARILGQVPLQPEHGVCVQVVGGLVQQQQLGALQEHAGQRYALALPAGKPLHRPLPTLHSQPGKDRLQPVLPVPPAECVDPRARLALAVEQPLRIRRFPSPGQPLADPPVLVERRLKLGSPARGRGADGVPRSELRLLGEHAHPDPPLKGERSRVRPLPSGHDAEQGGLAGTVGADEPYLLALVDGEGNPVENHARAEALVQILDVENVHWGPAGERCGEREG